jgi:hypothetical protein
MMNERTVTWGGYHYKHKRHIRAYYEGILHKPGPANQSVCSLKFNKMDDVIVGFHAQ